MKEILLVAGGIVIGITACGAGLAWYFRDVYK